MDSPVLYKLRGILPAIVSPHEGDDVFAPDAFAAQVEYLHGKGAAGLYVCGGTGEGYLMRSEERRQAAEIAVAGMGPNSVTMVHVGAQASRDAASLAEHAAHAGATAVASVPPTGRTRTETAAYYRDIAQASGLPVFVYHIPGLTHQPGDLDTFCELLDVPGVAGIKFSDSDLFLLNRLKRERPQAIVFNGSDELLLAGLIYGAAGGIGTWYNLIPEVFLRIYDNFQTGNLAAAWTLQERFLRLSHVAFTYGLLETFHLLMARTGRVRHVFRRPFQPFDAALEAEVLRALAPVCDELGIAV